MVLGVLAAAVERCWVQRVGLRVEEKPPRPENTLAPLSTRLPRRDPGRSATVQEVVGVKEQVEVLDGFGEEEGFHPVVELVVAQVFDLQPIRTQETVRTFGCGADFRLFQPLCYKTLLRWNGTVA